MRPRVLLLALPLTLAACGKGGFSKRASEGSGATLRYAMHTAPTTLDPALVQDVDTGDLVQNVYEGLVAYGEDNRIAPMLAEKWTTENGGRTYVFTLRAGAKFQDGAPVTAGDFVRTISRNLDPALKSPTASGYLGDIVGVRERADGKAKSVSGVVARDDRTLAITLDRPRPYFLGKLTYPCAFVLPKTAGPKEIASAAETVGTGPFRLKEYAPGQQVRLEAFPGYWGGAPKLAAVVRPVILDAAARLAKYENGELDLLTLERQDLAGVEAKPALKAQLVPQPRPAVYYLGFNGGAYPPFADRRVRRAFAMAVDRRKIASELVGLPYAAGLIPDGVAGFRKDLPGIPYDPAAARALLAEAGYPGGKGLPPLSIQYRDGRPDSQLLAVAAVQDLKKNLGIAVQPRSLEWRAFLEARNGGKFAMYGASWYADYLDPQNFLSFLLRTGANENHDAYSNPAFDAIVDAADVAPDGPARVAAYQRAEDLLLEDAARVPVYFGRDLVLVSPRVRGVRFNLFGQMPNARAEIGG